MKYQWILFDADETLFHFDAFKGLQLMFSRHDIVFTEDDFLEYQQLNKPLWINYQEGKITASELKTQRFQLWSAKSGLSTDQLNRDFLNAMADICTLLPHAKELIDSLKGRVKLGIITNGFTDLQQIRLEKTGLDDAFDLLVISEQVGYPKPAKEIFDYALKHMGQAEPNHVLMVGDNIDTDILGGINAGMETCWLNVDGKIQPNHIKPSVCVQNLLELEQYLLN
ncbi:pyrimidine 5'-nucleotidase [Photobacterium damselae]|uniref:Pyrimidine 5'-nucleotidase n=1 Tax=Photobacterium damsela subsp. piscicida TaxID=38294 RepID=A0A1V1VEP5_PHODP|nr:pyrimidine 5'-nucleotidase [Photobacterium damselae]MBE8126916.1 pyrimidine 5'-nucleotidase [Photobacterium damselae subsp. piscicida]MDP2558096.1 pyrimidine 5'-nucleotidase [Photobacterium damselae subsp. piscicida]ODA24201.1 noncanonical pyrimidine nucleotidase, YjjG family [Photobacterium damselae subsp. damselae]PSV65502.1 dUMP phosphatase [Photobacterium damselae]PSW76607.1 dUMP phosphatase [Photobacterium damselae]